MASRKQIHFSSHHHSLVCLWILSTASSQTWSVRDSWSQVSSHPCAPETATRDSLFIELFNYLHIASAATGSQSRRTRGLMWGVTDGAERGQPKAHGKRITIFQITNKTNWKPVHRHLAPKKPFPKVIKDSGSQDPPPPHTHTP